MRLRRRSEMLLAAAVTLSAPMVSHAALWKDGCPAFFPPETAPSYTTDIRTHDGSAAFSTLPEVDSLLGPTRFALESWASRIRPINLHVPTPPGYAAGSRTVLQGNLTSGPMFGLIYSGYRISEGQGQGDHLGNLTTFIGFRHTGYVLGPMFRTGFAVRIADGGPETARTSDMFAQQREGVAASSPFRGLSFGVDAPLTGSLEYRIEAIGCRNPFLDLRIDVSRWRAKEEAQTVVDVPIELGFGAYPWDSIAMYAAIGEEFRSQALVYRQITRITLGLEYQPTLKKSLRIGIRASGITGAHLGGAEIGLTLELLAPWWKETFE